MRPLIIEAIRDPQAIDGVNPLEVSCDITGLVRLNVADKVPERFAFGQRIDLGEGVLQVVFAEIALAVIERIAHKCDGFGLGYRDKRDIRRIAVCSVGGQGNAIADLIERVGD